VGRDLKGSSGCSFETKFHITSEEFKFSTGREWGFIFENIIGNPILHSSEIVICEEEFAGYFPGNLNLII